MPAENDPHRTIDTAVVHAGTPSPRIGGAVVTPVFQSANYLMRDEADYGSVRYIRLNNSPNHVTLHARLAAIENGEAALVAASGMAAITASLLAFAGSGDHVLAQRGLYGGTASFLAEEAPRLGISCTEIDTTDPAGADTWEGDLRPATKVILVEAISNPLMEVGDLEAVAAFAHSHGLVSIIDSTFATPVNLRPLDLGIDVVVHSATKYLNGHSDLVAGAIISSRANVGRILHLLNHVGGSLDPHACFLLERGLKTLAVRVRRQNESAQAIAEFLESHPAVRKVNYPGLPSSPHREVARRLLEGFGGMISFYLRDAAAAETFLDRLRIPVHAASLGGTESLVVRPSRSSHLGLPAAERERLGITDDLVRLSVGIEDAGELIDDLAQALQT